MRRPLPRLLAPLALVMLASAAPAQTTFTVNATTDASPFGLGVGSGASGDLRYCITQATTSPGDQTITVGVTGTITLSGALPTLNNDIAIQGPGPASLTVQGSARFRIFFIERGFLSGFAIGRARIRCGS